MARIRVLRLLEYTYDSVEAMEADMCRWSVPEQGSMSFRESQMIKSAVLPMEVLKEADNGA